MKELIISLFIVFTAMASLAQTQMKKNEVTSYDNIQNNQSERSGIYRLFPTQNMWTFIKLNTRNGKIWQVQYDVRENNRFETNLSLVSLATKEEEKDGRFTLYPTQNVYTFLLLDQIDGRVWQVQWSTETGKRFIMPIE